MSNYRNTRTYRSISTELTLAARYRGTLTYQDVAAMADLGLWRNRQQE